MLGKQAHGQVIVRADQAQGLGLARVTLATLTIGVDQHAIHAYP
jgi:hypothetical protein